MQCAAADFLDLLSFVATLTYPFFYPYSNLSPLGGGGGRVDLWLLLFIYANKRLFRTWPLTSVCLATRNIASTDSTFDLFLNGMVVLCRYISHETKWVIVGGEWLVERDMTIYTSLSVLNSVYVGMFVRVLRVH